MQPCTKKMKKSEENFFEEKVFFPRKLLLGEKRTSFLVLPKRTFSSSFVIDATDRQLIKTTKLNYIFSFFVVFLIFKTFYF